MLKVLTHNLMLIVAWLTEVFYRAGRESLIIHFTIELISRTIKKCPHREAMFVNLALV
jgi:hypothetical protein